MTVLVVLLIAFLHVLSSTLMITIVTLHYSPFPSLLMNKGNTICIPRFDVSSASETLH